MVAGRVVRFDGVRGYGFIAPDHGGEDVFLHVNDLLIPEAAVRPGVAVEFEVEDGGRGLKASSVRLAQGEAPSVAVAEPRLLDGEEPMCDLLSVAEYTRDMTELLLRAAPSLTGEQILRIRGEMLKFAKTHGWTEG
ncbi:cold shock domain-containing protein [Streptacidiphilus sp. PB12-B1b]|uniref:cold-shock protein n=1 Tax=Streptacidiphilus sp. PB12-B1b TaxID=2705012 RepID=UPI0015FAAD27|nr:cold shock domain-containing protein [Streptacidiphilus sp. PB12-B1b]QMU80436.1 cold shock domain-containing protein [Streptacidiphilus sp. PB12-B1b]